MGQLGEQGHVQVRDSASPCTTRTTKGFEIEFRALLQEAGYGVLSEIDVQAKLKEKLDIEREPYLILGACNPPLANQSLNVEPELGALLPCNVVVYEQDGCTHVAAVEPEAVLSVVDNEDLGPIAEQVRKELTHVVEELAKS